MSYLPNGVNTPLGVHAATVGHTPRVGQTKVAHGVLTVFGPQSAWVCAPGVGQMHMLLCTVCGGHCGTCVHTVAAVFGPPH